MSSESYHEPYELLADETTDMHRAIVSAMEELEAIDWYQQRAEACTDDALRSILIHNKHEEIEHALMTLEWIRRRSDEVDAAARRFLFTDSPIVAVEEEEPDDDDEPTASGDGSLGIASLRMET